MHSSEFSTILARDWATALLAFDFDGTLAAIAPRPQDARLDPELAAPLQALSHGTNMAVISGRPTAYLAEQLIGVSAKLIGNYGRPESLGREQQRLLDALERSATDEFPPEILVESKPTSLALHYRQSPQFESQIRRWAADQLRRLPTVSVEYGKSVVELVVGTNSDKGTALSGLIRGHTAVLYAGDDLGDLPAFRMLNQLAIPTCTLAILSKQTPQELVREADDPLTRTEFRHYLTSLAQLMAATSKG